MHSIDTTSSRAGRRGAGSSRSCLAGLAVLLVGICPLAARETNAAGAGAAKAWRFVSIPDFLNVDLDYPQPKWDDAIHYVLGRIKAENPDFVLVAGDLLMGRWWQGPEQIEKLGRIYYTAWVRRMQDHGLKFYAALGDHEIGDNPWPPQKAKLVPHFEAAFAKHLKMPQNGPPHMKGLAYSFVHKNCLFVAVNVFEKDARRGIRAKVSGGQLEWLDRTFARHRGADHVIVMGHTPILGPVRKRASSGLMLEGGRKSALWQLMKTRGVDLYLCGEVHAITCTEADGIEQIAHGSLFGYVETVNYLVATVTAKRMHLELKRIPIILAGGRLPQTTGNRPREFVRIAPEHKKKGFVTVGTMVIDKAGPTKRFCEKTGEFTNVYKPPSRAPRTARRPKTLGKADPVAVAARKAQLVASLPDGAKLAGYLDCGRQTRSAEDGPVKIELAGGRTFLYPAEGVKGVLPSQAAIAFDEREVRLKIHGLKADCRYGIGLTWWDFGGQGRTQSVLAASPDGKSQTLVVKPTVLPDYRTKKELPATVRFALPADLARSGAAVLIIRKDRGANAVLSELWVTARE